MAQDPPAQPVKQPPQKPAFPVEYLYFLATKEGNVSPFKYAGKSKALTNACNSNGQIVFEKDFNLDFDPTPTRPGQEELEAKLVRIDNEQVALMMSAGQKDLINKPDTPFGAALREFILINGSVHALSVGSTNAGGNLASYERAQSAMNKAIDIEMERKYTGSGLFKDGRPQSFWEKHPIVEDGSLFRIDYISVNEPVPHKRQILAVDKANLDLLFLPYWVVSTPTISRAGMETRSAMNEFVKGCSNRFFGVALTMWDLEELSKRRDYSKLEGSLPVPQELAGVVNYPIQSALVGGSIELASLGADLQKTVRMMDLKQHHSAEQIYKELEEDLKKNIYGPGRDITAAFIEPAVQPFLSKQPADYDGARAAQKAAFQKVFDVRKLVMDRLIPDWKEGMVEGLRPAYQEFALLAGWDLKDIEFGMEENRFLKLKKTNYQEANLKARDDRDTGLRTERESDVSKPDELCLKYRGNTLKTAIADNQEQGTYGVMFLVPNKLIDAAHPCNAGIKVKDGCLGYICNIIPPIGGTPFPPRMYTDIVTRLANRNAFKPF